MVVRWHWDIRWQVQEEFSPRSWSMSWNAEMQDMVSLPSVWLAVRVEQHYLSGYSISMQHYLSGYSIPMQHYLNGYSTNMLYYKMEKAYEKTGRIYRTSFYRSSI